MGFNWKTIRKDFTMDLLGLIGAALGGGKTIEDPNRPGYFRPKNYFWDFVSGGEGRDYANQLNMQSKMNEFATKRMDDLRKAQAADALNLSQKNYDLDLAKIAAMNKMQEENRMKIGGDIAKIQDWYSGRTNVGPLEPSAFDAARAVENANMQKLALALNKEYADAIQNLGNAFIGTQNYNWLQRPEGRERLMNINQLGDLNARQDLEAGRLEGFGNKVETLRTPGSLNQARRDSANLGLLNYMQNEKELNQRSEKRPIPLGENTLMPDGSIVNLSGTQVYDEASGRIITTPGMRLLRGAPGTLDAAKQEDYTAPSLPQGPMQEFIQAPALNTERNKNILARNKASIRKLNADEIKRLQALNNTFHF